MQAQCIRRRLVQLQVLLQIGGHAAIDVRKDMRRSIMQRVIKVEYPDPHNHPYLLLINVPTPSWVRISSNSACCTRPSMICTERTPPRAASSAEAILGNIPPDSVPSATSPSISLGAVSYTHLRAHETR